MGTLTTHHLLQRVIRWYVWLAVAARIVGRRLTAERSGQSMVEYAIVVALIAVVAMAAVQGLGTGIAHVFQNLLGKIQGIGG